MDRISDSRVEARSRSPEKLKNKRRQMENGRYECPSIEVDFWVDGGLGRVRGVHPRMMSRSGLGPGGTRCQRLSGNDSNGDFLKSKVKRMTRFERDT